MDTRSANHSTVMITGSLLIFPSEQSLNTDLEECSCSCSCRTKMILKPCL